ncbi:sigma-54-dependent Fis family transcriptional regulator [Zoogloea dura]|uniref:Sigma-54-dependent Fis family transcriptional regulator n=1 Tax=Zoogloea dura TaxID=2728840 RepID=A0A848GCB8_9RHOO|nr:sigma-54-dependent Fis family transcriptional regulator [Zoogloea dura]NML28386.1 sigma-54-dependent Fis family transcriptional regulator [Zoogloea dura]
MTPSSNPLIPRIGDEKAVATTWERFLADRPVSGGGVRDVVLDSWRRSRQGAVDPALPCAPAADPRKVEQLRQGSGDLYVAARPVLESLRDILCASGTLIMLSDQSGTILDLNGESRARDAGEQINLAAGGRWSEELIGTNAIGTAIATQLPVQIYASEHYCIDVKHWTCAAAPILDPMGRTLLGVVDVSGVKETFHGHTLGLVIAAAKQIEAVLARRDYERHGRLLAHTADSFTRYANDCVVLFDHLGRVVKTGGSVQLAREAFGVRLPFEVGGRVAALDISLPADERQRQTPAWLRGEWLHPVDTREGVLGSLLVIPVGARARPTTHLPSRGEAPGACPGVDHFADIIGTSQAITVAKARARRVAPLDLPVLLLGETGAGKEIFARAIHKASARPNGPFVAVNCGALTRELLASELFGYSEGAFTGARRGGLPGKFEQADGGTLFLDEIGEMPLDMQPHLLRVLQDGVVVRLGDTRERKVAVRIIAATNRDLQADAGAGRFREDLFHRLCVVSLSLPALRERPDDIEAILDCLNQRFARKYGCPSKTLDAPVRDQLLRYRWPGNIRELQNVFEAMFALSDGDRIDSSLLPPHIAALPEHLAMPELVSRPQLASGRLEEMERAAIDAAVAGAGGNLSLAARNLGISRSTLYVKLAAIRSRSQAAGPERGLQ